jgi:polyhydroxyalkanoate synthase subunit PhaC
MPPARKPATKSTARSSQGVRARASARSTATRREVEQSIARFEKRLDDANDALKTLGQHLGSGARGGYKDVTTALSALRRSAAKTNREALKEFDKLRASITKTNASSTTRSTRASSGSASSRSGASRATSRSTGSRSTASRSTAARSTASRSSRSRSTTSRAKKSS